MADYHRAAEHNAEQHDGFSFGPLHKKRNVKADTWRGITSSLSYSLLLLGIGLLAAIIFLLGPYRL